MLPYSPLYQFSQNINTHGTVVFLSDEGNKKFHQINLKL